MKICHLPQKAGHGSSGSQPRTFLYIIALSCALSLCWVMIANAQEQVPQAPETEQKRADPQEAEAIIQATVGEGETESGAAPEESAPTPLPSAEQELEASSAEKIKQPVKMVVKARPPQVRKKGKAKNKKRRKKRKRLRRFPTNRPKRALKEPPALGKIPFPLGETLTFKVNMLNAHSGTVTLKVGRRGKVKDQTVLELSGFVQSSPVLENFYPIRDSLRVLVDERTFQPVKSEFFLNEKGRKIEYTSEFNQSTGRLDWMKVREVKGKKKTTKLSYMAPHPMHQTLSSLYALRRLSLEVGMSFEQYIWDGQRERLILVKVVGEERVLTGIGWVEAYKLEITGAVTGGIISKRTLKRPPVKGTAWIAKDAYRTPIKAITPTKLGQAEAVLSARAIQGQE